MKKQMFKVLFEKGLFRKLCLICVMLIALIGIQPTIAGNKKFMTINAAKVLAERAIVESVIGLKIRTSELVQDMVAIHQRIDAKTAANIKGVEFTDIVYDKAKDIAKVTARINLGRVRTIVGKTINWRNRNIERVAFATSTRANAGALKALRAAELDAYSQLAKRIVGFKLISNTTVENYILKSDEAKTRLLAAIYGANLVSYRWDADGDAYVKLSLQMGEVEDILGQKINYGGTIIEVEGSGATKDDFNEKKDFNKADNTNTGGKYIDAKTIINDGVLNIPISGEPIEDIEHDTNYNGGGISLQ